MTNPSDKRDAKDATRRERKNAVYRTWYATNRERINADRRHRYATDAEYRADRIARTKKRGNRGWRRWKYGLSDQDFEWMIKRQHGLCLICWKKFTRTPCVDHSHPTRMVRSLLCHGCNVGFGSFFENPEFLRRAADFGEFFAAHEQAILRGDPAALQEAGRLRTALLAVDITSLLPPQFRTAQPVDARGKPPPRKTSAPTVTPPTIAPSLSSPASARLRASSDALRGGGLGRGSKKHAQSRSERREQKRPHDGTRGPARAAAAVRSGRASARRQAASGRAQSGRKGARRPSQRDQGSGRPHRRQRRDGRQRTR